MASSAETRERLANELRLDVIGPSHRDDNALRNETLPDPPSRWYLTGFLVPLGTAPRQKAPDPQEEMDAVEEGGVDDDETPERGPSRPRYLPSPMGLSLLVEPASGAVRVCVSIPLRRGRVDRTRPGQFYYLLRTPQGSTGVPVGVSPDFSYRVGASGPRT